MRFPRLASDHYLRARPTEAPFALVQRAANADHIHCLNVTAEQRGLHRSMPLADARAICPDLSTRPADLQAEARALEVLRRWACRYSPHVARDGSEGLIADVSGVAHLFGGEAELRADLQAHLERSAITVTSAIAGTRGAAVALATNGGGIIPDGQLADGLAALPVAALRIDSATAAMMERLGISQIADLIALPRAPLSQRFGPGLVHRLDQALGRISEPVAAEADPPHYGVRLTLPEPIGLISDITAGLDRLLDRLCATLAETGMGARRVRLDLHRVDRATVPVEIGLARPMRDPRRIAALFARGLDGVDAGFGIEMLRVTAMQVEPMPPEQIAVGRQKGEDALADLITRLGNRLGFDRVTRLLPAESAVPERSFLTVPSAYVTDPCLDAIGGPLRPAVIFPPEPIAEGGQQPPARFKWRRMALTTARATGPERITAEWWFDDPAWRSGLRDYWRIETNEGPRLWLFHTPQVPCWSVQGIFA